MIALDTNLLVYAHRRATPLHGAARRAIERARRGGRGWGFTESSVLEFWAVVTHPSAAGRPSSPAEASGFLAALKNSGAQVWAPGPALVDRLLRLAEALSVAGPRIFDLQIALTAIDNGVTELWTHDARFVVMPGLKVVDPFRVSR